MAEKFSMSRSCNASADPRSALIEIAGDPRVFDSRTLWLERAASKIGISARTAKAIFYREMNDPKGSVIAAIDAALKKKRADVDASLGEQAIGKFEELSRELEALREAVRVQAPDVYRAYCNGRRIRGAVDSKDDRPVD